MGQRPKLKATFARKWLTDSFCAVRGAVLDGHQFVADAAGRGAAAALVESRRSDVAIPQTLVRNGRRAAAVAAETWYGRPASRLQMIGVTGTNGKTTSVILARHVLSARWPMGTGAPSRRSSRPCTRT